MAKPCKLPDFRKIYPEASEEVIAVLKITERKMQYQEYDLKAEQTIIDEETQTVTVIPSREDSYERMKEAAVQFTSQIPGPEELVIQRMEAEQLYKAISCLSADDQYLIRQLYFEERTERDLATELQLSQKGINKRKNRILSILRELMKNFCFFSISRFSNCFANVEVIERTHFSHLFLEKYRPRRSYPETQIP